MIVDSIRNAAPVVIEFCDLQRGLVERFLDEVRPNDLDRFSDIERTGNLSVGAQRWSYIRHGAGVSFEIPGAIVDAHVGVTLFPDAVDGWRLLQYLESIGVTTLTFDGEHVATDDEKSLEYLLERMEQAGILEAVYLEPSRRLFCPSRNRRTGT
ncbi:DUF6896 domain-containing protein [Sorangium sp. So ce136]|uniref:DUF6896 domain-containing protein n=1 Tax=Sorangium sp. So ce136 TaxID=3133284 RepID=UPI003F5205A8